MMIGSATQYGLQGIQTGMDGLRKDAQEIASASQMNGAAAEDVTRPLVDQTENLRQVEASTKVVAATDGAIGTLIDVMA